MIADAGSSDDHAAKGPISLLARLAGEVSQASSGPGTPVAALLARLLTMPGLMMAMPPAAPAIGRNEC
jgi:hypothetical protein